MRYVRFSLIPEGGSAHPIDGVLAATPGVRREAIHSIRLVSDETAVTLYQLDTDAAAADQLAAAMADHPDMVSLDVSWAGDRAFAYAVFRVNDTVRELLEATSELVLEPPLEYTTDGRLRGTAIGTAAAIRGLGPNLPDGIRVEIESIGEYQPEAGRLWSELTARQQETLRAAVDLGYYDSPREATYADVADRLGISTGTVGEHLQKVEKRVLRAIVPDE